MGGERDKERESALERGRGALRGRSGTDSRGLIWKSTNRAPSSAWAETVAGPDWRMLRKRELGTQAPVRLVPSPAHSHSHTRTGKECRLSANRAVKLCLERMTAVGEEIRREDRGNKTWGTNSNSCILFTVNQLPCVVRRVHEDR